MNDQSDTFRAWCVIILLKYLGPAWVKCGKNNGSRTSRTTFIDATKLGDQVVSC